MSRITILNNTNLTSKIQAQSSLGNTVQLTMLLNIYLRFFVTARFSHGHYNKTFYYIIMINITYNIGKVK